MRALSVIILTLTTGGTAMAGPEAAGEVKVVYSDPIRRQGRNLATVGYAPLKEEVAFIKKVNEPEIALWGEIPGGLPPRPDGKEEGDKKNPDKNRFSKEKPEDPPKSVPSKDYRLTHCDGRYAGWFGILREVRSESGRTTWLVEHKYFDGLCDAHIQIVSIFGAGDFTAAVPAAGAGVPSLSLVRIYGPVKKAADGTMTITPEFIRVWKQPLFTFMDYGEDHSNPKWTALRKVAKDDDIYSPSPDEAYYEDRLGSGK